ncbi:hypothetical protein CSUI_005679 [Cystoisospora suis]|uniref:Uncharacterized protein n=1 Tax=Cystoisospora suis TaxID=483139 RepID=A0A2C6KSX4_9APIC|nr:hypothetical protein CSUI_005679 [Cystoisospora suis]
MERSCETLFSPPSILGDPGTKTVYNACSPETPQLARVPICSVSGGRTARQVSASIVAPEALSSATCILGSPFSSLPPPEDGRRSSHLQEDSYKLLSTRNASESTGIYYHFPPFLPALNLLPHCERFSLPRRGGAGAASVSHSKTEAVCLPSPSSAGLDGKRCSTAACLPGRTALADPARGIENRNSVVRATASSLKEGASKCVSFLRNPHPPSFYPLTPEQAFSQIKEERVLAQSTLPIGLQTSCRGANCLGRGDRTELSPGQENCRRTPHLPGSPAVSGIPGIALAVTHQAQQNCGDSWSAHMTDYERAGSLGTNKFAAEHQPQKREIDEAEDCGLAKDLPRWSVSHQSLRLAPETQGGDVTLSSTEGERLLPLVSFTPSLQQRGEKMWELMKWLTSQKIRGDREFLESFQEASSCFFVKDRFHSPLGREKGRSNTCCTQACLSPPSCTKVPQMTTAGKKLVCLAETTPPLVELSFCRERDANRCRKHRPPVMTVCSPAQGKKQSPREKGLEGGEKEQKKEQMKPSVSTEKTAKREDKADRRRDEGENRTGVLTEGFLLSCAPREHLSKRAAAMKSVSLWRANRGEVRPKGQLKRHCSPLSRIRPSLSSLSPFLTGDCTFAAPLCASPLPSCSPPGQKLREGKRLGPPLSQSDTAGQGLSSPSIRKQTYPFEHEEPEPVFTGLPSPALKCKRGRQRSCVWRAERRRQLEVAVNGEGCTESDDGEQVSLRFSSERKSAGYRTNEVPRRETSDGGGTGSGGECLPAGDFFGHHGQKLWHAKDRRGSDSHEVCYTQGILPKASHSVVRPWTAAARRRKSGDAICTSWQREISKQAKDEKGGFALPDQKKTESHSGHSGNDCVDESTADSGEKFCEDQQVLVEASVLFMKRRQYVKLLDCLSMLSEDHDVLLYEKDSLALLFPSLANRHSLHAFSVRSSSQCSKAFDHRLEKPSLQSLLRCQCITEAQDDCQLFFCPRGVCSVATPLRLPSLPESLPSSLVSSSSPSRPFLKLSKGILSREMDELHSPLSFQSCTSPSPGSDPLACLTQAPFFSMSPSPLPSRSYRALAAYVGPVVSEPPVSSLPLGSRSHSLVKRSCESRRVERKEEEETRQRRKRQSSDPSFHRRNVLSHEFRLRSLRLPAEIAEKLLLPHPDTRAIVDLSRKRNVHHPLHPLVQLYLHLVETETRQGGPEGRMVFGALPVSAQTKSEGHSEKETSSCVQRIFEETELTFRDEELLHDDRYWGRCHRSVDIGSSVNSEGYTKPRGAEDSTAFLRWNRVGKLLTGGNREETVDYWDSAVHGRKGPSVQRVSDRDRRVSVFNTVFPSHLGGVSLLPNWERGICDDMREERLLVVAQGWAEKRKQDLFVDLIDIDLILKDMRVSRESDISRRTLPRTATTKASSGRKEEIEETSRGAEERWSSLSIDMANRQETIEEDVDGGDARRDEQTGALVKGAQVIRKPSCECHHKQKADHSVTISTPSVAPSELVRKRSIGVAKAEADKRTEKFPARVRAEILDTNEKTKEAWRKVRGDEERKMRKTDESFSCVSCYSLAKGKEDADSGRGFVEPTPHTKLHYYSKPESAVWPQLASTGLSGLSTFSPVVSSAASSASSSCSSSFPIFSVSCSPSLSSFVRPCSPSSVKSSARFPLSVPSYASSPHSFFSPR